MKLVDLFAGCGGLSLGMEKAGFEVVFANEIEKTYAETYIFNRNLKKEHFFVGDINFLNEQINQYDHLLNDTDLVCGGPPCQGFSMANRQRVIDDPRNNLYKAYLLFLNHTQPRFFVMENVKGMMNKIQDIKEDFSRYLGNKYNFSYIVLNAKDFGIPQNRERFFFIGNRIGISSNKIIEDIWQQERKTAFTLGEAINGLPALQPKNIKNDNSIENEAFGYTAIKYDYPKDNYYHFINDKRDIGTLFNHKNRYNNERDIEIYKRLPQGANSLHPSITDIMPYKSRNHIFKDKYFKLAENQISKTITSHMKFDCNMYIHPTQARGLSPREAARLQTFPDDYVFKGSQNSWYAQVGNAVPVKLAEIIGKHIIKHLK